MPDIIWLRFAGLTTSAMVDHGMPDCLSLDITQNHLGTLLDFQNLLQLPGRVYQVNRDPSQNRDSYLLNYSGVQALAVIQAVLPYLMRKQHEAQVAIEFMTQCHIHRHFGPRGCPEHVWLLISAQS